MKWAGVQYTVGSLGALRTPWLLPSRSSPWLLAGGEGTGDRNLGTTHRQFSSREAGGEDTAVQERAESVLQAVTKGRGLVQRAVLGRLQPGVLLRWGTSSAGPSMLSHGGQPHGSKLQPAISIHGPRGSTHVLMIPYGECVLCLEMRLGPSHSRAEWAGQRWRALP